ncbi:polysaccharide deacetylase family sporulation protein PdaB [Paenibacillus sp. J2TS4]|uniref:polysaccharide deacetylase family sporulation protein PdaB n=1 Tax=Paenibacillus sp. J2TS4 TaxID=2807194 RepID=UPI001B169926|nr:polysaccharide deacetylase family sporulation protein PdaB [Paenibacillus sp. J2TS4]GIP33220.1 polysaccharide deacetylase PdaB family [Paenibacillus sp. J2TS4]
MRLIFWNKRFIVSLLAALMSITIGLETGLAEAPDRGTAIYKVDTDEKVVALTFDISWGNKYADPIMDVLADKDIYKATFFLSGPWALKHEDIVRRIDTMGFEIGSHGWKHVNYSEYSDEWIAEQVKKTEDALIKLTNKKPVLFRTPNGDFNPRVIKKLNKLGYEVIQWDTDSLDWMKPGVDKIINRVLKRAHPGDIILLHASDSVPQTPAALPVIIDGLKKQGYRFVTVTELMEIGEQKNNK